MPNSPLRTDPEQLQAEADLIERIYTLAINPQAYDDFMESLSSYVGIATDELNALRDEAENDGRFDHLSRHFDIGFKLLEELGRSDREKEVRVHNAGAASLLVDRKGKVVWFNGAASRFFSLKRGSKSDGLSILGASKGKLDGMIALLGQERDTANEQAILPVFSAGADKTVFMLAEIIENGDAEKLVMLTQIISSWHDSLSALMSHSFELSTAELNIAELLVEGATLNEIADLRATSVNTVRTQIKSLLAKTGISSQTALVRLLVSLNGTARPVMAPQAHVRRGLTSQFQQRTGRIVPFHSFGPDDGRPFVMFHGMLDGCDLNTASVEALHRHKIRIIAPERPFFGSAVGSNVRIADAPQAFAEDIEDLLDHLRLDRVGLLGHMAGSVYAFAAAAHLGARAYALVSVSGGVPIVSADQLSEMTRRQRIVAYTARYTPKLLPFLLRGGIRQLDFGGEDSFMHALYENAPQDLAAITVKETAHIIATGYHFSVAQGHRAFERDSYHVVRDWSAQVAASDIPVTLIHGREDGVVRFNSVERFAKRLGQRARLIVAEDTGQLVFYQKPDLVVSTLASIAG